MFHMKSCVPGINCTVEAEEGLYLEGGRIQSQDVAAVIQNDTKV